MGCERLRNDTSSCCNSAVMLEMLLKLIVNRGFRVFYICIVAVIY